MGVSEGRKTKHLVVCVVIILQGARCLCSALGDITKGFRFQLNGVSKKNHVRRLENWTKRQETPRMRGRKMVVWALHFIRQICATIIFSRNLWIFDWLACRLSVQLHISTQPVDSFNCADQPNQFHSVNTGEPGSVKCKQINSNEQQRRRQRKDTPP